MIVRQAGPDDHRQLNDVMRRASLAVESGEVLRELLQSPELLEVDTSLLSCGQVVLAESDGIPIGFASFTLTSSIEAELDGMFVDPMHWRRGVGRMIFEAVELELGERRIKRVRVVAGSQAVDFYRSVGFSIIGEEKTPLGPTVPVMLKTLT